MKCRLDYSVLALLFLVVLTLITVLTLVWTMPGLSDSFAKDTLCLQTEKHGIVCGASEQLVHDYLNKAIQMKYRLFQERVEEGKRKYLNDNRERLLEIYDKYYWEMKPLTKLTGNAQTLQSGTHRDNMRTLRDWENEKGLYYTNGFERYGARQRNGRIVVPVPGIYFVYSHLNLFKDCNQTITHENPIRHAIYKFNIVEEVEIPVISGSQPHKVSCENYNYNSYSSYISALVELKAGDELSVKVSDLPYLKYPGDNYFGVNFI